jgi:hypothetical protein
MPWGFQEFEFPRIDNRNKSVVGLSAQRTSRFYSSGNISGTDFCAVGRIILMSTYEFEHSTLLLIALCLNQTRHWLLLFIYLFIYEN